MRIEFRLSPKKHRQLILAISEEIERRMEGDDKFIQSDLYREAFEAFFLPGESLERLIRAEKKPLH